MRLYDDVEVTFIPESHNGRVKHGAWKTAEYCAWQNMKARCIRKSHPQYKHYGGRGITVCERWLDPANFLADMGKKPRGARYTLERVDNDGGYSPDNCKWATTKEQILNRRLNSNNKSGHRGVYWDKHRSKWLAKIKVNYKSITVGASESLSEAVRAREKAESEYGY